MIRVLTPGALEALAAETREPHRDASRDVVARTAANPRIRLVLGQPPPRFSQERLGTAYLGTCWALGREAASLLPLESLLGPADPGALVVAGRRAAPLAGGRLPRISPATRGSCSCSSTAGPKRWSRPCSAASGPDTGCTTARLSDPDDEVGGVVELIPAGAVLPPGPRTRSNVPLEPGPGDRGDPDLVPGARPVRAAGAVRRAPVLARRGRGHGPRDRRGGAARAW